MTKEEYNALAERIKAMTTSERWDLDRVCEALIEYNKRSGRSNKPTLNRISALAAIDISSATQVFIANRD